MRDAVRNTERWEMHRAPTQNPSTSRGTDHAAPSRSPAPQVPTPLLLLLEELLESARGIDAAAYLDDTFYRAQLGAGLDRGAAIKLIGPWMQDAERHAVQHAGRRAARSAARMMGGGMNGAAPPLARVFPVSPVLAQSVPPGDGALKHGS